MENMKIKNLVEKRIIIPDINPDEIEKALEYYQTMFPNNEYSIEEADQ